MSTKQDSRDAVSARQPRSTRRPWRAPRLTEYGPVAKLTQTGAGSLADGGHGKGTDMRTCL
jgi:hypothetical protein